MKSPLWLFFYQTNVNLNVDFICLLAQNQWRSCSMMRWTRVSAPLNEMLRWRVESPLGLIISLTSSLTFIPLKDKSSWRWHSASQGPENIVVMQVTSFVFVQAYQEWGRYWAWMKRQQRLGFEILPSKSKTPSSGKLETQLAWKICKSGPVRKDCHLWHLFGVGGMYKFIIQTGFNSFKIYLS